MAKKRRSPEASTKAATKAPKGHSKGSGSLRPLCFGLLGQFDSETLLLLPAAAPKPKMLSEAIEAEMKMVDPHGTLYLGSARQKLFTAIDEHRVLWGWSPWRAQADSLTWEHWDQFCERWFSLCTDSGKRPQPYGELKKESVQTLCDEVNFLVHKKKVKLVSNWPSQVTPATF